VTVNPSTRPQGGYVSSKRGKTSCQEKGVRKRRAKCQTKVRGGVPDPYFSKEGASAKKKEKVVKKGSTEYRKNE